MIKQKKDLLALVLFAILFGFIVFCSYNIFLWSFNNTSDFLEKGSYAFFGAFFAFLFVRLGEFLTKLYKRQVMHYNSLVNLGNELNELIGIIDNNLFLMPTFKSAIIKGNIYWSAFNTLPLNKTHLEKLYDRDLINRVFIFNYKIRVLNEDIENLMQGYSDLKNAYINKHIKVEHYIQNAVITAKQIDILEPFFRDLASELQRLLARVRIHQRRDKPLGTKIMELLILTSGSKISKKDEEAEVKKLQKELNDSRKASKKENERIQKKK